MPQAVYHPPFQVGYHLKADLLCKNISNNQQATNVFEEVICGIFIMELSSETPRAPRDKVGDLPHWTARGIGNSPDNFPQG